MKRILALGIVALACALTALPTLHTAQGAPEPTVVIVGDSITAGTKLDAPWRDAWASRLANNLYGYANVQNDAIGGQCLVSTICVNPAPGTILNEWDRLLNQPNVKVAIIAGGTNDLSHIDNATFTWAYVQMMQACRVRGITCWVSTITPPGFEWPYLSVTEGQREQVNNWLRATYPNNVIDFDAVLRSPWFGLMWSAYDSGDGLHPNWIGEVRMADMVPVQAIRQSLTVSQ